MWKGHEVLMQKMLSSEREEKVKLARNSIYIHACCKRSVIKNTWNQEAQKNLMRHRIANEHVFAMAKSFAFTVKHDSIIPFRYFTFSGDMYFWIVAQGKTFQGIEMQLILNST